MSGRGIGFDPDELAGVGSPDERAELLAVARMLERSAAAGATVGAASGTDPRLGALVARTMAAVHAEPVPDPLHAIGDALRIRDPRRLGRAIADLPRSLVADGRSIGLRLRTGAALALPAAALLLVASLVALGPFAGPRVGGDPAASDLPMGGSGALPGSGNVPTAPPDAVPTGITDGTGGTPTGGAPSEEPGESAEPSELPGPTPEPAASEHPAGEHSPEPSGSASPSENPSPSHSEESGEHPSPTPTPALPGDPED